MRYSSFDILSRNLVCPKMIISKWRWAEDVKRIEETSWSCQRSRHHRENKDKFATPHNEVVG